MRTPTHLTTANVTLDDIAGHVRRFYPHAHTANAQLSYLVNIATQQYGIPRDKLLYAQSVCSDDVNAIKIPLVVDQLLGPFGLGGLDGYPFTGLSGMAAYAAHVPDHGAAFIFCAPHVGVSDEGILGKIRRHGHLHDSGACGAALSVLKWLVEDGHLPAEVPYDDRQMYLLHDFALRHRHQILSEGFGPQRQLHALTEALYEEIWKKVVQYVKTIPFACEYVFVAGGVLVNTSSLFDDYLSLRNFEVYRGPSDELVKSYQLLPEFPNWGAGPQEAYPMV